MADFVNDFHSTWKYKAYWCTLSAENSLISEIIIKVIINITIYFHDGVTEGCEDDGMLNLA